MWLFKYRMIFQFIFSLHQYLADKVLLPKISHLIIFPLLYFLIIIVICPRSLLQSLNFNTKKLAILIIQDLYIDYDIKLLILKSHIQQGFHHLQVDHKFKNKCFDWNYNLRINQHPKLISILAQFKQIPYGKYLIIFIVLKSPALSQISPAIINMEPQQRQIKTIIRIFNTRRFCINNISIMQRYQVSDQIKRQQHQGSRMIDLLQFQTQIQQAVTQNQLQVESFIKQLFHLFYQLHKVYYLIGLYSTFVIFNLQNLLTGPYAFALYFKCSKYSKYLIFQQSFTIEDIFNSQIFSSINIYQQKQY
ncbi:unnamed protein product (macronuclear) [Paramecium tetraurelia]|uniref:Transmembrane protein n=1 Tax=Paramecium tetraurelia TaxID=5888 RepID=A0CNJ4_PARTE|nr:uncharacterized protein GSPATT00008803001 [Paramecium tetraurelia]CAK72361.1 unnamed protein product [Paramecium tetraurelia]|eukprot:XP_001439758.1 hypothetical protein (macronuclear) [Paramecium tetraurelia strain d4-2]